MKGIVYMFNVMEVSSFVALVSVSLNGTVAIGEM
jgi:hypothetical protein